MSVHSSIWSRLASDPHPAIPLYEEPMTEQEVQPYVGKAVRLTLDDGRVLAGTLHADDTHGHGHTHYAVVSDPIREGGQKATEVIHGSQRITVIEDASGDPAAVE